MEELSLMTDVFSDQKYRMSNEKVVTENWD